ncbi:HNH endonuclease [Peribacillus butanolivorans]|uniref:HNH endonuclease n=1 Tax=Peribacillus butanolivorans TaxID=421767 RepID=UPI0037CB6ABE
MEEIQEGVLRKFQAYKGRILIGKEKIKGKNSAERLPIDEFVSGTHILHDLIRGFYKPARKPYLLSYQATESEDNYGEQIVWEEKGESFTKINMHPPRGEKDNRKISDIKAARYNMENKIPIGIMHKIKKSHNKILGLGLIVAEGKDGVFTVVPYEFQSEKVDKVLLLEKILVKENIDTDVVREVVLRKGQGDFKRRLLVRSQECELCGLKDEKFLIASHIKPWKYSSHNERLDINNGLLLCPNHDKLFDAGYITFSIDGNIIISPKLMEETKNKMLSKENISISYNRNAENYLKWHMENCYKK